mmetsp:Transcript_6256/g.23616  ORF Transcript_6256/g.23616 Transcript_6256/m.23616 type:complete len:297 (-) Transcript_6256:1342-2232(-)
MTLANASKCGSITFIFSCANLDKARKVTRCAGESWAVSSNSRFKKRSQNELASAAAREKHKSPTASRAAASSAGDDAAITLRKSLLFSAYLVTVMLFPTLFPRDESLVDNESTVDDHDGSDSVGAPESHSRLVRAASLQVSASKKVTSSACAKAPRDRPLAHSSRATPSANSDAEEATIARLGKVRRSTNARVTCAVVLVSSLCVLCAVVLVSVRDVSPRSVSNNASARASRVPAATKTHAAATSAFSANVEYSPFSFPISRNAFSLQNNAARHASRNASGVTSCAFFCTSIATAV